MAKLTNAERQRQYRANKKGAIANPQTTGVVAPAGGAVAAPVIPDADALQIDVKIDETPLPKLSLKERLLAKMQGSQPAPIRKAAAKGKGKQDNLLSSTLPTVLCSFVATYSRNMIPDPYKDCAPSQQECTGMLGPLMDILARQVEITGKASQTTIDLMNSIICSMMFGIRSYMTYMKIKEKETPKNGSETTNTLGREPISLRTHQGTANGPRGNHYDQYAIPADVDDTKNDVSGGRAPTDYGIAEGENWEALQVSNLFSRDKQGRVRLGLLPPAV